MLSLFTSQKMENEEQRWQMKNWYIFKQFRLTHWLECLTTQSSGHRIPTSFPAQLDPSTSVEFDILTWSYAGQSRSCFQIVTIFSNGETEFLRTLVAFCPVDPGLSGFQTLNGTDREFTEQSARPFVLRSILVFYVDCNTVIRAQATWKA